MSVLPSFAWPAPELVGLLGVDYVRERLNVVVSGYSQLCSSFSSAADDFVSPLVTLSDEEVLRVVRERRARGGSCSAVTPLELRDTRTHSAVLAEHGATEVAEFDRWLKEKRARGKRGFGGALAPHQYPEVVESRVAVMVAKNKLELDATRRVQQAVEERAMEPREALLVTTSRLEAARVKRVVGSVPGREVELSRAETARAEKSGSLRASRVPGGSVRRGSVKKVEGDASPEAVAGVARTLDTLRAQVYAMQEAAPVVDYDDMGECGMYRDAW